MMGPNVSIYSHSAATPQATCSLTPPLGATMWAHDLPTNPARSLPETVPLRIRDASSQSPFSARAYPRSVHSPRQRPNAERPPCPARSRQFTSRASFARSPHEHKPSSNREPSCPPPGPIGHSSVLLIPPQVDKPHQEQHRQQVHQPVHFAEPSTEHPQQNKGQKTDCQPVRNGKRKRDSE